MDIALAASTHGHAEEMVVHTLTKEGQVCNGVGALCIPRKYLRSRIDGQCYEHPGVETLCRVTIFSKGMLRRHA